LTPRYRLLQAREAGEHTRAEEHAAFADKLGLPIDAIEPFDLLTERPTFRAVTRGVDAVLVGGSGRFGINDDVPWLPPFIEVLGQLAAHDFPTFASCFGFQGLVVALGSAVAADPLRSEVGTFVVSTCRAAEDDPVFSSLPARFTAQMGHKDSATSLPDGAVHLVRSERCAYQAVRLGRNVYATQFHPELSGADNRHRFRRYYQEYSQAFGEDEARSILDAFQPSPDAVQLLPRFVDVVVG